MKLSITWGLENKNMESKRLISQACLCDIFSLVGIFKFQIWKIVTTENFLVKIELHPYWIKLQILLKVKMVGYGNILLSLSLLLSRSDC